MRSLEGSISKHTVVALFLAIGCGGHVSTDASRSNGGPPTVSSRGDGGRASTGSGGRIGATGGAGGAPSSGGRVQINDGDGGPGAGGAFEPPPPACSPLVDAGSLFSTEACGTVWRGNLPTSRGGVPFGAAGPYVFGEGGVVTSRGASTGVTSLSIDAFDRSAQCLGTLGVEAHSFNHSGGIVKAETRGETAAVLVDCDSDLGACGSTLYINGKAVLDLTQYPVDPVSSNRSQMAVNPYGSVLVVTDTMRIGGDVQHRARLVSYDGAILSDVTLPADRFYTSAVAADMQGRYVLALVGQPQAGQARSALEVLGRDLTRLTFLELREDIEVNALWADSLDTVIAAGQEGSPDPYGYVEAFSLPDLVSVWPTHPHFPLGYAHAVDVGRDGTVWVVGDDPSDAIWLASYDQESMKVTVAPAPTPANDYSFATWSISALDDGTVLFAHDSVYSYCR